MSAESRQILCPRIQPVPLIGADAVHQPLRPSHVVCGVEPGEVDLRQVTTRVIEQVPGVQAGVGRVGHRGQRGDMQPSRADAVWVHVVTCSLVRVAP